MPESLNINRVFYGEVFIRFLLSISKKFKSIGYWIYVFINKIIPWSLPLISSRTFLILAIAPNFMFRNFRDNFFAGISRMQYCSSKSQKIRFFVSYKLHLYRFLKQFIEHLIFDAKILFFVSICLIFENFRWKPWIKLFS